METKNSNKDENKTSRRKRRAERNQSRTMKYIFKLLDNFENGVLDGYSHANWGGVAAAHRQLSPFLSPEEYHDLGRIWADTWMQPANYDEVNEIVSAIKDRVDKGDKR